MPRIEEVQLVHWGSLRPDPIPLLIDGINVATGPNGSGKTCFLDGIKLLLGVTSFAPGRSSHRYIFDGGPGGAPAERAFLRATFSNPVLDGSGERLFAAADERLRDADLVSVICLVTADSRRYLVLPGLHRWGFEQPLADDLEAFLEANPEGEWLGPRRYDELLDRTGITRALREVLALPQGAIDRTMDEPPAGLLARLLELTGERALLDEVEAQRERADDARTAYLEAVEAARAEQDRLAALHGQAARHLEWAGLQERLDLLRDLARPAAEHRDVAVKVEAARAERDAAAERIAADRRDLDELTGRLPALEARTAALADQAKALVDRLAETRDARAALEVRLAAAEARAEEAQTTAVRLAGLAGERTTERAGSEIQAAESSLAAVLARREELRATLADVQARMAVLAGGGVPVPAEVAAFRERLAEAGIEASVVAEVLELADEAAGDAARVRAEAALGDALWALLVPSHAYRQATALAVEAGYRWGIARGGAGDPRAALTAVLGPVEAGLLLERADAQAAHDAAQAHGLAGRGLAAVAPDGMRYGDAMARLEAPGPAGPRPQGQGAAPASASRPRPPALARSWTAVDAAIAELRGAWQRAMHVLDAVQRLDDLQGQVAEAEQARERAGVDRPELVERERAVAGELRELDGALGAANAELALARQRQNEIEIRLAARLPELAERDGRLAGLETELAGRPLAAEQRALLDAGDLPGTESVLRDIDWLGGQVEDEERFPAEVRDPELVDRPRAPGRGRRGGQPARRAAQARAGRAAGAGRGGPAPVRGGGQGGRPAPQRRVRPGLPDGRRRGRAAAAGRRPARGVRGRRAGRPPGHRAPPLLPGRGPLRRPAGHHRHPAAAGHHGHGRCRRPAHHGRAHRPPGLDQHRPRGRPDARPGRPGPVRARHPDQRRVAPPLLVRPPAGLPAPRPGPRLQPPDPAAQPPRRRRPGGAGPDRELSPSGQP